MNQESNFYRRMEQFRVTINQSEIHYRRYGAGPQPVFCFHGYGEDGTLYKIFEIPAGNRFSFYAIDLPFHGKTTWKEDLPFSEEDLSSIVGDILRRHGHAPESLLTLMGFSLGGRAALCYYQAHPRRIKKMILLAPDGLKMNFWYALATQNRIGNALFAYSMKKPAWFFALLKVLSKVGVVNASIFKFVNQYIGNEPARHLLYKRWSGLRRLRPAINRIKMLVKENETQVKLVYGKYDRIIIPARGEKFRAGIEKYCTISVIHSGHQVVHVNHLNELLPLLSD